MSESQTTNATPDPYAVPSAPILERGRLEAVRPASRFKRLVAYVLNAVGAFVSMIPFAMAYEYFDIPYLPGNGPLRPEGMGWIFLAIAPWALVNVYLIHTRSQSVGKCILDIQVVRKGGGPATTSRQLLLRFFVGQGLLGVIPFIRIIDALCIFQASRQTLHDGIADTIVVRVPQRREWDQRSQ